MKYLLFSELQSSYKIAILIREFDLTQQEIIKYYIDPLVNQGIDKDSIIAFSLDYFSKKKPSAKDINQYLDSLIPKLHHLSIEYILCCDSEYFKKLTKKTKAVGWYGYKLPIKFKDFTDLNIILGTNYNSIFYNTNNKLLVDRSLNTLVDCINNKYNPPGNIIKSGYYPNTVDEIKSTLDSLHQYSALSIDIETKSLQIDKAGLETIAFSWSHNEGIAFIIDKDNNPDSTAIRLLLKEFLINYKNKFIYHNGNYDIKVLIYELWMNHIDDIENLLIGLNILTNNIEDTQIITYLATNTTAGNKLSLKDLSQEFTGNYAQEDINDTTLINSTELLEYNLIDTCATYWVYSKYYDVMCLDNQLEIYRNIFLPAQKVLIQTELTGMPLDIDQVSKAENQLQDLINSNIDIINQSIYVNNFNFWLQHQARKIANSKLKKKVKPYSDFKDITFNPKSGKQIGQLLHTFLGLEVLDQTPTGEPATGSDDIKKHLYKTTDTEIINIINAIIEITKADKIINTFIKAFKEKSILHTDGLYYLHGNFNITGTQSHRLSSSNPNLQNLPSGSTYGKLIKKCFVSPNNQIMCGADFNALEARIGALLTRDPNKVKIYTEGYDSHSLAAFNYWPSEFPDIVDTPESVNTIAQKYPKLRSKSKTITFAAQYGGTYITFMNNGFSKKEAQEIERNYHKMYEIADQWTEDKIKAACNIGYVPLAFGGRLRTPVLSQVIYGDRMPYKASEEARSAGNALMQSYGLLNTRAAIDCLQMVVSIDIYALT